jgi:phosphopentomutase
MKSKSVRKDFKAIVLVLDGVGIGEIPDSVDYGDKGSNTLGNLAMAVGGLNLPNFEKLGLGMITSLKGLTTDLKPIASYGSMLPKSKGKDSTTGHWELMGLVTNYIPPLYPNGFPSDIIESFEKAIGRKVLGNKAASGTQIIEDLGPEHIRTGFPILYTSADSVFQVAAHKNIIPLDELYKICEVARKILTGKHAVLRVIARPFTGEPGNFKRTYERKDYGLNPPGDTLLDNLSSSGYDVITVGKIDYIFTGRGITDIIHTEGNEDGMRKVIDRFKKSFNGLMFVNFIDFDMQWGHRNDTVNFHKGLIAVDNWLPGFLELIGDNVPFFITADHGCDPTTPSTDHSREQVPLLAYCPAYFKGSDLGKRESFTDLAATLAEYFELDNTDFGQSFLDDKSH